MFLIELSCNLLIFYSQMSTDTSALPSCVWVIINHLFVLSRDKIMKYGVSVRVIGDVNLLPDDVKLSIARAVDYSKNNTRYIHIIYHQEWRLKRDNFICNSKFCTSALIRQIINIYQYIIYQYQYMIYYIHYIYYSI